MNLWSCRLGFDSKFGQTSNFKIGIHSVPARRSALKEQYGDLESKALEKALNETNQLDVVNIEVVLAEKKKRNKKRQNEEKERRGRRKVRGGIR